MVASQAASNGAYPTSAWKRSKNPRLIQAARTEAHALVQKDPQLSAHRALRDHIETVVAELHSK